MFIERTRRKTSTLFQLEFSPNPILLSDPLSHPNAIFFEGGVCTPTFRILAARAKKRISDPLRGSTLSAKIARRMKAAGQIPRETGRPIVGSPWSNQVGYGFRARSGEAEATLPGARPPRINLLQPIRMGAWNVTSCGAFLNG